MGQGGDEARGGAGGAAVHVHPRQQLHHVHEHQFAAAGHPVAHGLDGLQGNTVSGRGAHAGRHGGGQDVQVDAQVDGVHAFDEAVHDLQDGVEVAGLALLVREVLHAQLVRGAEQDAGVVGLADAQHGVVERAAGLLVRTGHLQERGAGGGLVRLPQVEVGVQVQHTHALVPQAVAAGASQVAAPRGVVAATQDDHGVARVQEACDLVAQGVLAVLQVAARDHHGAGVVNAEVGMHRQRGEGTAQGVRALGGAHAALVAAHALVAGEADELDGGGLRGLRSSVLVGAALSVTSRGVLRGLLRGFMSDALPCSLVPAQVLRGVPVRPAAPHLRVRRGDPGGRHAASFPAVPPPRAASRCSLVI